MFITTKLIENFVLQYKHTLIHYFSDFYSLILWKSYVYRKMVGLISYPKEIFIHKHVALLDNKNRKCIRTFE